MNRDILNQMTLIKLKELHLFKLKLRAELTDDILDLEEVMAIALEHSKTFIKGVN